MLITRGNLKLGILPGFSLPIIMTCPGKTAFCDHFCFGLFGNYKLANVKEANDRRLDTTFESDFVDAIVEEITREECPAFRLHIVGDFYNIEYIEKWIAIATRLPKVVFFGSTRSWRCAYLSHSLKEFRDLPNVYMKASTDLTDPLGEPPSGWSTWSVDGKGFPCPHDYGKVESCTVCRRCWTIRDLSVTFKLRWASRKAYERYQHV